MGRALFGIGQLSVEEFDIADASTPGVLAAAPAVGLRRRIYKIELSTSVTADLTVTDSDGAPVTPQTRGFLKDTDETPWYKSGDNATITAGTNIACRVAGRIWFEDGAEV